MAEILDIVDERGLPTGETVDRGKAHEKGIRHRTAHVWILRKTASGTEVLLQKRSKDKDSNPGCYDISSAGHIPAGQDDLTSALRELKEELGISDISREDLHYCGQRIIKMQDVFHGKIFIDNQISNIYCLWRDVALSSLTLQESEVEAVIWMNLRRCKTLVQNQDQSFPNCIYLEELAMLPQDDLAISETL